MNIKRSKLIKKQRLKLTEHFVAGATARTTAEIVGVNKNTALHRKNS
jgi:transposase